ncbi:MAG: acetate/propionate family kinase [Flavobacteriaceae bacterium]
MNILVINSGSSSIKFQLISMPSQEVTCSGLVERIGLEDAIVNYKTAKVKYSEIHQIPSHKEGLEAVAKLLMHKEIGVIGNKNDIQAIGHRVVHGGSYFSDTVKVDQKVKDEIEDLFGLAPLHNPANLEGIEVAETIFPNAAQVAVFDTAYHQSIPERAYRFAIDKKLSDEQKIRVYGFHGTSHKFVASQMQDFLGKENCKKLISIHLGNGCSITAIKDGKSIDHSLGMGPVNGLIMGTRSGDIDQSVIFYLMDRLGYSSQEANNFLQKKSGMLGLTGYSDLRDIEEAAMNGNRDCQLALEMAAYRIKKFIGSYIAALNGVDAIAFTAGIGENSNTMRSLVCQNLNYFGIELDEDLNEIRSKDTRIISKNEAQVKVVVCPTNEELEIAIQSFDLLNTGQ